MYVDRQEFEPPSEEEINAYVAFSAAVIDNIELNGNLFEAITSWSRIRMMAYQQAFLTLNMATDPDSFNIGFDED